MEVILLEKIRHCGNLGDVVKVKAGFGRNYLLPQKKAVIANALNLKSVEAKRSELEKVANDKLALAQKRADDIVKLKHVTIMAKIAEEGRLYGSIGIADIVEALKKADVLIEKSELKLPEGPIRHVGEYDIPIYFHTDVTSVIKVVVIPEPA